MFSFLFLLLYSYLHVCAKSLRSHPTLCDPVDCSLSLFMGFSRQEYWSTLPYPPPGDLPDPGIKPVSLTSPASAGEIFTTSATWTRVPSLDQENPLEKGMSTHSSILAQRTPWTEEPGSLQSLPRPGPKPKGRRAGPRGLSLQPGQADNPED